MISQRGTAGFLVWGLGAGRGEAWFKAQTTATISNTGGGDLSASAVSSVSDYEIGVALTWTGLDATPVQVDNKGHEKVYIGTGTTNLRDLDETPEARTARADVVRYYTVNLSVTAVNTAWSSELAAAVAGKTFSGDIGLTGNRFVLRKAAPTFNSNPEDDTWHTTDVSSNNKITFTGLQLGTNAGNNGWTITSAGAVTGNFYVVVKGQDGLDESALTGSLVLGSLTAALS